MEIVSQDMPLFLAPGFDWFRKVIHSTKIHVCSHCKFDEDPRYNRLLFAGPHGKQQFSIPLIGETKKGKLSDVMISYSENWHNQLINALRTAYGKSPFYEYYDYKLEPIIKSKEPYLAQFNLAVIRFLIDSFKIKASLIETDSEPIELIHEQETENYYQVFADRNGFFPNLSALDYLFNEGWDKDWSNSNLSKF